MSVYKVSVFEKPGVFDAIGQGVLRDIHELGISSVKEVRSARLYYIAADIDLKTIKKIARELLVDKAAQEYSIDLDMENAFDTFGGVQTPPFRAGKDYAALSINPEQTTVFRPWCRRIDYKKVEIAYNPGVMDPAEESVLKAVSDMGILGVDSLRTAREYQLTGSIPKDTVKYICERLLYNKIIEHIISPKQTAFGLKGRLDYQFRLVTVGLIGAKDKRLIEISRQGQLFLNIKEMRRIRDYFKKIGRNPTDCELETIAQTWSEHCRHKTFKGRITYTQAASRKPRAASKTKIINNLLKSTIMRATKELNKPWCVSVFTDNAGVIKFDDDYNICFKVETHNHPSALEPFGGANTGIGGVIRDPLGTGLGAKPILNTDVFCFGPADYPQSKLPEGSLHPKRIAKGVVAGVRDYANKMGIPTVNGAVLFDSGYVGNPLVYCGTAGLIPKDKSFKKVTPGDLIVVVGGRTGRDGIHGATFSSGELTHQSQELSSGAVQIGNPITEKKVLDTLMQARDKGLYSAITDCGAGGFSSAIGEMGENLGARVNLEKAPLKYQGLSYSEIWISEAQERMVLSVAPKNKDSLLKLFADENVEAAVIGEFTSAKRLELFYQGNKVADLDMNFLHNGLPDVTKKAFWRRPIHKEPRFKCPKNLNAALIRILSHYNVCSKEWIIRQYDHEVQGGSVLKPLTGIENDGPSDAAIVKPRLDSKKGVIVSCGINPRYGLIDPYWMAVSCVDEALRQIVAVGGSLKQAAILDNFCWGNPDKPDCLGSLVRAAEGCYYAAKAFAVPFISGKDSLYNEYRVKGKSKAIPGTLLISAIAVMDDISKAVSMDAKRPGSLIYIVGQTCAQLGGSIYFDNLGFIGNEPPSSDARRARTTMDKLSLAASRGLLSSTHDCSEGGLGGALAEMAFSGGLGMEIFLQEVPYGNPPDNRRLGATEKRNDFILFSESNTRFVVEVESKNKDAFEKILRGEAWGLIGCLKAKGRFKVYGLDAKACIDADIRDLKEAWQRPMNW